GQPLQTARQEQLALLEEAIQAGEELAAEDTAEHAHWQEEAGPTGNPARRRADLAGRITRQGAAAYDTSGEWESAEGPAPGVMRRLGCAATSRSVAAALRINRS